MKEGRGEGKGRQEIAQIKQTEATSTKKGYRKTHYTLNMPSLFSFSSSFSKNPTTKKFLYFFLPSVFFCFSLFLLSCFLLLSDPTIPLFCFLLSVFFCTFYFLFCLWTISFDSLTCILIRRNRLWPVTILIHAKLLKTFWVEALMTIVYVINRSPSTPLDGDVPPRA